ncbi:MAG: rhodanese-like domain-containing protein [Bacteroidales bacterium]
MDTQEEIEIKEQSSTSKTLLTGIVLFATIIVLGLVFMPKPGKTYKISTQQMLGELISLEGIAGPELIVDLIYNPNDGYRFIDLRSTPEYLMGHLPNAINIPVNHLMDKEYEKILNQKDKINILYASDHADACGPWMILYQLGYKNNKIMLGGYKYVNDNIINKYAPLSGNFKDEKANSDFAKIISQTSGSNVSNSASANDKPTNAPVVKKKKEAKSGGGC